jgi:hypothetical protein
MEYLMELLMRKNNLIKIALLATLTVDASNAIATPVLVLNDSGNTLMGINGVVVGGLEYNVAFGDTETSLWKDSTFITFDEGRAAMNVLGTMLNTGGVAWEYGGGGIGERVLNGLELTNDYTYNVLTHVGAAPRYGDNIVSGWYFKDKARMLAMFSGDYVKGGFEDIVGSGGSTSNASAETMTIWKGGTNATWSKVQNKAINMEVSEPTTTILVCLGFLGYTVAHRQKLTPPKPITA